MNNRDAVSVSLQTDLKEQFADRPEMVRYIACQHADSDEDDTARYEAIIRIRRDRTRSALYFDVVNAPFARYILRIKRA